MQGTQVQSLVRELRSHKLQAAEQLSPRATATEPQLENPWATLHDPRRSHVPQVRPDTDELINYKQEGRGEV